MSNENQQLSEEIGRLKMLLEGVIEERDVLRAQNRKATMALIRRLRDFADVLDNTQLPISGDECRLLLRELSSNRAYREADIDELR